MNAKAYGIDWIKQDVHHRMKETNSPLIIHSHSQSHEQQIHNGEPTVTNEFLINDSEESDLDQIAAQNLIFMARDGQITEIIEASGVENGTVIVASSDGSGIDYDTVLQPDVEYQHVTVTNAASDISYVQHYGDEDPQMVTEEVITDDWVQHQGEERVEISEEQIFASSSQTLPEVEVPLPTIQDEYTALRPYPCDFCSRRFKKKTSLINHLMSHQNDRPHLCQLCDSRFFRKSELIKHLQAHAEEEQIESELEDANDDQNHIEESSLPVRNDHYYEHDWQNDVPVSSYSNSAREQIFTTNASISENVVATTSRGRISRLKLKEYPILEDDMILQETKPSYYIDHNDGYETKAAKKRENRDQKPHLLKHFPVLNDSKPFVCQQCGLAFAREKALLSHSKSHHIESQFECNQCTDIFLDEESLQEHQKVHQFEESNSEFDPNEAPESQSDSDSGQVYAEYYCSECGIAFHRQDLLKRHERLHLKQKQDSDSLLRPYSRNNQGNDLHCCNTCGESFEKALDLLAHAEVHARSPTFKCQLCGESFNEESAIKHHLLNVHPKEITTNSCILCGKHCKDRKALMKHAWEHSREKCHSCSKCGKSFHNKARLKRHMSSHRDKSVTCDVCHEEFPDGRSLSNHRHSHSANSNGKLFPCNECGKTFGSRSSQQIHVRIHTGERPYGCRFCWKAFADGGTLRKHERIHTGEKPYACSVCPRAFNQRVVLREHIRSHHSALDSKRNAYFCSVCSSELPSSNDLIQHLIEHSDKNTAMQRAPVTGPRKYKRRRKLKPHELAHLRNETKQEENNSELDISDFDMDNVDDILGIADPASASNSSSKQVPLHSSRIINKVKQESSEEEIDVGEASSTESMTDNLTETIWEPHLIKKSVSNHVNDNPKALANYSNNSDSLLVPLVKDKRKTKHNKDEESTAQRTQRIQYIKTETNGSSLSSASSSAKSRKKTEKQKKFTTTGPRMIHTEKLHISQTQGSSKKRSKAVITRSEPSELNFLSNSASSTIVDDYEIISPDIRPPNQISSSPSYTKLDKVDQGFGRSNTPSNQLSTSNRNHDMFDTQLLLEASSLRKNVFEKFNPGIVNDLEEILGSPLKGDKNGRQRFTSESSTTQFMTEQSEEDQHLIKIEPTSPDLRDIVTGGLNITTPRSNRRRRKYLEFDTNDSLTPSFSTNSTTPKRSSYEMKNSTARTTPITKTASSRSLGNKVTSSSFSSFSIDSFSSSPVNVDSSSYFSISAVVSAADATAAAAAAAANGNRDQERSRRMFECEMCSEVFSDRAQLLDHVHIHI